MARTARSTSRRRSSSTASGSTARSRRPSSSRQTTVVALRRDRSRRTCGSGSTPPRRPDGPRHGRPPARRPARSSASRSSPRARRPRRRSGRRRRGRRRGPGQEDRGRLARVRRRARDARLDGPRRQARQDPRPARPDAEPRRPGPSPSTSSGRSRRSRAAASSTRSTRPASSTSRSARAASSRDALAREPRDLGRRDQPRQAGGRQGPVPQGLTIASTMGPGIRVDVPGVLGRPPRPDPSPAGRRRTRRDDGREARHLTQYGRRAGEQPARRTAGPQPAPIARRRRSTYRA